MWNIDSTRCMCHSLYSCFVGLGPTGEEDTEAAIPCLHSKIETNTLPAAVSLAPATSGLVTVDSGSVIACHIAPAPHECWAIAKPTYRRKFAKTYDLTIHFKRGRRAQDGMIWIGAGSGQDCYVLQTYTGCVANGSSRSAARTRRYGVPRTCLCSIGHLQNFSRCTSCSRGACFRETASARKSP